MEILFMSFKNKLQNNYSSPQKQDKQNVLVRRRCAAKEQCEPVL